MKPYLLFPSFFRPIGIVLALTGLVFGYIYIFQEKVLIFADHGSGNFTDELGTIFEVLGLIFIGFSRLKNEDERTSRLRLEALYWAVLTDFLLLFGWLVFQAIDFWLKTGLSYPLSRLDNYNLFIILFIFLGRFYYVLLIAKEKKKESSLALLPYKPYLLIVKAVCILFFILIWASIQFSAVDEQIKKILPDTAFILFPVCLLIWIWSKEKNETPSITKIRLKSTQIAVYINYSLYLIATWAIYGFAYLEVLFVGLLSTPIIFLVVFYLRLPARKKEQIEITHL
ncbi:hypothetical protein [Mucilaginibacter gotjawali]|uniref:Uncharacterized protein n=1 Tax=Mucilaginibacter gotjawali TaxID=1550579 RepID=A0A839SAH5_9SPHI|nr:hypothetical protein [Mucilaginibacter gotjawali]MBB3054826.1 hypothetical protein [Mucilaginibacter gotjawali]